MSGKIYRKADRVLITSQMFREYLARQHGVENDRLAYLPQYASECFEEELSEKKDCTTVDLMFAGNVGAAQGLTTVIKAAAILKNETALRWHIVGDGSELENLKTMANQLGLANVIFHGRKKLEEMPKYYAMADAMLVTLMNDPFISLTLPGKVQTYMAAGKPIIGAAIGEIPKVIEAARCGYCADAEDTLGLAKAVQKFLECESKQQLGRNAKQYYEDHFTRTKFMDTLEDELKNFAAKIEGNKYIDV